MIRYVPPLRLTGVIPASSSVGIYSESAGFYRAASFGRQGAVHYPAAGVSGVRYPEVGVRVGIGESMHLSTHARTIDY